MFHNALINGFKKLILKNSIDRRTKGKIDRKTSSVSDVYH